MEIWKDIKDYEGLYQISNMGNVRSLDLYINIHNGNKRLRKGIVLKGGISNSGYNHVNLSKNNKTKTHYPHRLCCEYFVLNPENKPEVNHINGIKTDNRAENLEWCNRKENIIHSIQNGARIGVTKHDKYQKLLMKDVIRIKRMLIDGISPKHISKHYPVSICAINDIRAKRTWGHVKI